MELPEGFIEWALSRSGLDGEALLAALQKPAAVAIRGNRRKLGDSPVSSLYPGGSAVEWCASGLRLPERPVFTLNPLLHAGLFYVQDPSSMIHEQIAALLAGRLKAEKDDSGPLKVLDFCAAPGGKTTAMIGGLPDGTQVVANEVDGRRRNILRENLEKWGYPDVIVTGSRSADYASLGPEFDIVAVDAPCSGEGMMRKEEEARRQWSPQLIADCASLQREILSDVVAALRPGGYLIYSTCTFNEEEDERNVARMRDELGLEPALGHLLPSMKGIESVGREIEGEIPCLRFMPHMTDGEGLFVTVMRKPDIDSADSGTTFECGVSRLRRRGTEKNALSLPWMRKGMNAVGGGESRGNGADADNSTITALPEDMSALVDRLRRAGVRVVSEGLPAASVKGRDIVPDGRSALSMAFAGESMPDVALKEQEALQYLRMELLRLPQPSDADRQWPKGYVTVSFDGHRLGMMKNLGNRANTLLPKLWRIRLK